MIIAKFGPKKCEHGAFIWINICKKQKEKNAKKCFQCEKAIKKNTIYVRRYEKFETSNKKDVDIYCFNCYLIFLKDYKIHECGAGLFKKELIEVINKNKELKSLYVAELI